MFKTNEQLLIGKAQILSKLIQLTEEGKVEWKKEDMTYVSFNNGNPKDVPTKKYSTMAGGKQVHLLEHGSKIFIGGKVFADVETFGDYFIGDPVRDFRQMVIGTLNQSAEPETLDTFLEALKLEE